VTVLLVGHPYLVEGAGVLGATITLVLGATAVRVVRLGRIPLAVAVRVVVLLAPLAVRVQQEI
jgi:hypothetical protein